MKHNILLNVLLKIEQKKHFNREIFSTGEISGISLISKLNHFRANFWSAEDPGIHILSFIIIFKYVYSDDIRICNTISINSSLLSMEGVVCNCIRIGGGVSANEIFHLDPPSPSTG